MPKSQLQSVVVLKALPPVPSWMLRLDRAVEEYREVGPLLIEAGLLTRANLNLFCSGCMAIGQIIRDFEGKSGRPAAKATLNQSLMTQYKQMLTEFGLTPTSQVRRGGPEAPKEAAKAPENPFEANKRKAA